MVCVSTGVTIAMNGLVLIVCISPYKVALSAICAHSFFNWKICATALYFVTSLCVFVCFCFSLFSVSSILPFTITHDVWMWITIQSETCCYCFNFFFFLFRCSSLFVTAIFELWIVHALTRIWLHFFSAFVHAFVVRLRVQRQWQSLA